MSQAYDPETVPIQLAATVILVDDRPDLQVLCLRRRAGSAFVGGMTVFPGGGLDPDDHDPAYAARVLGRDAADADRRLGGAVASGEGLAYWVAVARETFEEVGVLLARPRGGGAVPTGLDAQRAAVDAGTRTLLSVLDEQDLDLDLGAVLDIGRWITPVGAPRRYDTQFFVARMPAGQVAVADDVEAVHAEWRTPAAALADYASGELLMLPPTVCLLQVLARFTSADAVLAAAARASGPGDNAHIDGPDRGPFTVTLPGDPGYDDPGARATLGWVYALHETELHEPDNRGGRP
jgi:8-oxo-dGTP pyrophosphatase MutT (NUDIX family)